NERRARARAKGARFRAEGARDITGSARRPNRSGPEGGKGREDPSGRLDEASGRNHRSLDGPGGRREVAEGGTRRPSTRRKQGRGCHSVRSDGQYEAARGAPARRRRTGGGARGTREIHRNVRSRPRETREAPDIIPEGMGRKPSHREPRDETPRIGGQSRTRR